MKRHPIIIQEDTIEKLVKRIYEEVSKHGENITSFEGKLKVLNGVTLILENPSDISERYPYWDEASEKWYLQNFVSPQVGPPETINRPIIYPYTYSWRSHYYDQGWGYVFLIATILQQLNYSSLPFSRAEDLNQLISETYRQVHPDVLMAVLAWIGKTNLEQFIAQPDSLSGILSLTRRNVIAEVVAQLQSSTYSNHALTPSMHYIYTDNFGFLNHTPAIQSYQVITDFDSKMNPVGFESFHLQKTMSADGSGQLDFAHDIEWGKIIQEKTGLPLTRITIYVNQLFLDTKGDQTPPQNIMQSLLSSIDGYEAANYDIQKRFETNAHRQKLDAILEKLNP